MTPSKSAKIIAQVINDLRDDGENLGTHAVMVVIKTEDVKAYVELVENNTILAEEEEALKVRKKISPEH